MTFGPTATGFKLKTFEDLIESTTDRIRAQVSPNFDLTPSNPFAELQNIFCLELADAWEALQEAYNVVDIDNASDERLIAMGLQHQVFQLPAATGSAVVRANFLTSAGVLNPGDVVFHVEGDPTNRWELSEVVSLNAPSPLTLPLVSQGTGSSFTFSNLATLVAVTSPPQFQDFEDVTAVTPGRDLESIDDFRIRLRLQLGTSGASTIADMEARLLNVDGVISAKVSENNKGVTNADGLPPNSVRAVVWDGVTQAANDAEIADALAGAVAAGILTDGSIQATTTDSRHTVSFSRPSIVEYRVVLNYHAEPGRVVDEVALAEAVAAVFPNTPCSLIASAPILCAAIEVDGVAEVSFHLEHKNVAFVELPLPVQTSINHVPSLQASDVLITQLG